MAAVVGFWSAAQSEGARRASQTLDSAGAPAASFHLFRARSFVVNASPLVSVVVPTRNSASTLERLLRSVEDQSYSPVELIVVDNCSDDETGAIAARHADQVVEHGPERSAQRNRGVALASGQYVLILDADMELTPGTIAECVSTAMQSGATAVVVPERTVGAGFVASCRALERRCYEGDSSIEAARFFTREAFQRAGGYDETLTGPEDWDLPARMRDSGEVLGRADNAMINHDEGDLRLGEHLRKKYYYGKSFGTYVRRHPELARAQINPLRPSLVRNWRRLFARPVLGCGVVVLKAAEFGAGGLGLASTLVSRK